MTPDLKAQEQIRDLQRRRREAAWEARRAGWSTRQIGEFLGTSHVQVQRDIAAVEKAQAEKGQPRPATSKMHESGSPTNGEMLTAMIEGKKFT